MVRCPAAPRRVASPEPERFTSRSPAAPAVRSSAPLPELVSDNGAPAEPTSTVASPEPLVTRPRSFGRVTTAFEPREKPRLPWRVPRTRVWPWTSAVT